MFCAIMALQEGIFDVGRYTKRLCVSSTFEIQLSFDDIVWVNLPRERINHFYTKNEIKNRF